MGDNFGVAPDKGWFNREIRRLERLIEALRSERRANGTSVDGDFTIENGGTLLVESGGNIRLQDGTLDAVFIFLYTHLRPGEIRFGSFQPGSEWEATVSAAGIDSDVAIAFTTPTNDVRIDHTTTASAANAYLDAATKRLYRSTSSLRYKQDDEPVDIDPKAVLAMIGKTWRDRNEVSEDPDTEKRYVGFIAEELHELGLTEFIVYDADGEPEAIAYDRLSVALLAVLKDHDSRIARLETLVEPKET